MYEQDTLPIERVSNHQFEPYDFWKLEQWGYYELKLYSYVLNTFKLCYFHTMFFIFACICLAKIQTVKFFKYYSLKNEKSYSSLRNDVLITLVLHD